MRTPLLASLVGIALSAGCVNEITGVGDDDGMGDDGNGSGSGSGSGSNTLLPRIDATVDRGTVMTELGKTETIVVTVTGVNGFSGSVPLTLSLLDANNAAVNGFTLTPTPASVDVPTDGMVTASIAVKVPTDAAFLTPTLKIDLGGTAPTNIQSSLTIEKKLTIYIPAGTGTGAHTGLPAPNQPIRILSGTVVDFHNNDGTRHIIHADGGLPHEPQGDPTSGEPNGDYTMTLTDSATWYCHDHEGSGQARPIDIL